MTKEDHLARLLATFPDLEAAVAKGVDWESSPDDCLPERPEIIPYESIEGAIDSESEPVPARVIRGVRLQGGLVYDVRWLVDGEGYIRDKDSCDLESFAHRAWYEDCGPNGTVTEWVYYISVVAKTGKDPLDVLIVPPAGDPSTEEWQVLGEGVVDIHGREGLVVQAARKHEPRRWLRDVAWPEREGWIPLAALPEHVRAAMVGCRDEAKRLLGIDSLQELTALAGNGGDNRGFILPNTLGVERDGMWLFKVRVEAEPLALRTKRAAEAWLAAHPWTPKRYDYYPPDNTPRTPWTRSDDE